MQAAVGDGGVGGEGRGEDRAKEERIGQRGREGKRRVKINEKVVLQLGRVNVHPPLSLLRVVHAELVGR